MKKYILILCIQILLFGLSLAQVTINPENIGIGTQNPLRALHIQSTGGVGDDIILESTGNGASQLNFWRSDGTPQTMTAITTPNSRIGEVSWRGYNGSSYRTLGTINVLGNVLNGAAFGTGSMQISLSNTSGIQDVFTLDGNGVLKLPASAASGRRDLEITPDGTVRAKSYVLGQYGGVASLTAFDFVSYNNPGDDHNFHHPKKTAYHEAVGTDQALIAPIHLPQGTVIKQFIIYYYDNASGSVSTSDLFFDMLKVEKLSDTYTLTPLAFSSGQDVDLRSVTANVNIPLDNFQDDYFFFVATQTTWPSSDLGIKSVTILYD